MIIVWKHFITNWKLLEVLSKELSLERHTHSTD